MLHHKFFSVFLTVILVLVSLVSCNNDTVSGIDDHDIPTVPNFISAYMADEMFNDNEPGTREATTSETILERVLTHTESGKVTPGSIRVRQNLLTEDRDDLTNFELAGELLSEVRMTLQSVQFLYYQLFIPVIQRTPGVSDNTFIWEYEMPVADSEMVLDTRVTVEPASGDDEFIWTINIKGLYLDDPEMNVTVLESTSTFDGSSGSAQVNMPVLMGGELFQSELNWIIEQNLFKDMTYDFEFDDEEADQIRTHAIYEHDTEQSIVNLSDARVYVENELDVYFDLSWDPENHTGSIKVEGDDKLCWNEDHQNTACE